MHFFLNIFTGVDNIMVVIQQQPISNQYQSGAYLAKVQCHDRGSFLQVGSILRTS